MGGFLEVVFETGRNSVMSYDDLDVALAGVKEHHRRAKKGERALLDSDQSPPAERITRVLRYDVHPNELNPTQTMSSDVLEKELKALVKDLKDENGVVQIDQLVVHVRGLSHPMVADAGPHDSIFKMAEQEELDSSLWEGDE